MIATTLAHLYGVKKTIVTTNVGHVYSGDIHKDPSAKKLSNLSWKEYLDIIPNEWSPGLSTPVDPIAAAFAKKHKQAMDVINGKDLDNLQKCIDQDKWDGTTLS